MTHQLCWRNSKWLHKAKLLVGCECGGRQETQLEFTHSGVLDQISEGLEGHAKETGPHSWRNKFWQGFKQRGMWFNLCFRKCPWQGLEYALEEGELGGRQTSSETGEGL